MIEKRSESVMQTWRNRLDLNAKQMNFHSLLHEHEASKRTARKELISSEASFGIAISSNDRYDRGKSWRNHPLQKSRENSSHVVRNSF